MLSIGTLGWLSPWSLVQKALNLANGAVVKLEMKHIIGFSSFETLNASILVIEINGFKRTSYNFLIGILQLLQADFTDP